MKRGAIAITAMSVLVARAAAADEGATCVAIDASVLDARARAKIEEQLGAALAQHGIATCAPDAAPLAHVAFEAAGAGDVAIRIHVRDEVTSKELARVVRVASIPRDGRPLALAVAADELLRASWAEIALTRAPAPPAAAAVPEPVRAVVKASLPAAVAASAGAAPNEPSVARDRDEAIAPTTSGSARTFFLGASLAGEHAFGGLTQAGFDARAGAWLAPRFAIALRLGARASPAADAPDGTADASGLLAGAGIAIAIVPRGGAVTLDVPLRVDGERLVFAGHAAAGARASSGAAIGVLASTGIDVGLRVSPLLALDLEATIGAPLRPVEATDAAVAFNALSSAVVGVAIGARVAP